MPLLKKLSAILIASSLLTSQVVNSQTVALTPPSWANNSVVYSLFLRDFSSSGDFNGATDKLPELKKLGIDIVWLLPIHPIGLEKRKGSIGSPYSIQDYYAIHPSYGSKEDFKRFVKQAHLLGMKVIIDMVINHSAWDCVLMKNPEFYLHDRGNNIIPPMPDWYDVAAFDFSNPNLRIYMIALMKHWLQEFELDGYRLDAASMVPIDFWVQAREELHKLNPNILLLGEEDLPEGVAKAFDIDYAWDFEKALSNIIMEGAPATATIKSALEHEKKTFPKNALHLRFSDNHDKRRAVARYGENGALAASALIFAIDGVPLIYNGMEVGDTTESCAPALFEKMPIFWNVSDLRPEFRAFYTNMITLRKEHSALRDGELIWLENSDEDRIITFVKREKDEEFFIAINFSNRPFQGFVSIENAADFQDVTPGHAANSQNSFVPNLSLRPWEFSFYRRELSYKHN